MGATTDIGWTDHTFNPWWGCERVSPGCQHCYAETFAKRTGHNVWGHTAERRMFGDKHWAEPLAWDRQAAADGRRHLVFCASMADVFEDRPELRTPRWRLFELIEATPHLTWQLLTKRPENIEYFCPLPWNSSWPNNCWIGTTVEDQERAEQRIPLLLWETTPAPVRFLSCEPLLGPVDLTHWFEPGGLDPRFGEVGWVIVGGESGAGHRPLDLAWLEQIVAQCRAASVPVFVKQDSGQYPGRQGRIPDRLWVKEIPA